VPATLRQVAALDDVARGDEDAGVAEPVDDEPADRAAARAGSEDEAVRGGAGERAVELDERPDRIGEPGLA
jgi:hypothetical protein